MIRTSSGFIESRLVDIGRPILRVPNLAVHYDQQNPFKYNTELDLLPVAGMMSNVGLIQQVQHKALDSSNGLPHSPSVSEFPAIGPSVNPHQAISSAFNGHGAIATIVAESLSVRLEDVVDFDLSLYDTQKAAIGGENSEFIFASRIDNLMMTFCAVEAFTRSLSEPDSLENESSVRLLAMFDSEEISSRTTHGGRSSFLINTLRRITNETRENIARKSDFEQSMAKSFLISADMLHATHPHLASWHETNHSCLMNSGLVFASDSGRDFTKNTPGEVFVKEIISHGGLPYPGMTFNYQILTPPNNVNCGTTLGPILSMKLGVRTVDIGNAQLSMHSIREMAGTWDVEHAIRYLHLFFERFSVVNGMINVG